MSKSVIISDMTVAGLQGHGEGPSVQDMAPITMRNLTLRWSRFLGKWALVKLHPEHESVSFIDSLKGVKLWTPVAAHKRGAFLVSTFEDVKTDSPMDIETGEDGQIRPKQVNGIKIEQYRVEKDRVLALDYYAGDGPDTEVSVPASEIAGARMCFSRLFDL